MLIKPSGPGAGRGTAAPTDTNDLLQSAYVTDLAAATRRVQAQAQRAGFTVDAHTAAQSVRARYDNGEHSVLENYHRATQTVANMEKNP